MSLATLIYLADVLHSLAGLFVFLTVMAFAFTITFLLVALFSYSDHGPTYYQHDPNKPYFYKKAKPWIKWAVATPIALGLVTVFIPTKQTIYLMAGAHIGTEVLASDVAQDVYDILKQEIKKIKNESAGDKK